MTARIVVLASGSGTTLQAILDDAQLRARMVARRYRRARYAVHWSGPKAPASTRSSSPFADYPDRGEWNDALEKALADHDPDLVVLAGFMRILGPRSSRDSGSSTPIRRCCRRSPARTRSATRSPPA